ncbi:MAG: PilC/PilY family type IV pilus protein, partial [Desulfuromonadales bacterium]
ALYDAGHYFNAVYPGSTQLISSSMLGKTVPAALRNDCGFNYVILITNGLSNGDSGSSSDLGAIGDYDQDGYPNESVYGLGSHYLDDVARYLNKPENNFGITVDTVLAFQSEDDLVHHAATMGGGKFYNVYNEEELEKALHDLLASIVLEADTAFVAPVVPTNPENRTFSGQRVYLGFFYPKTQQEWYGNLKKFGINTQNEIVDKNGDKATCPDTSDNYCSSNEIPDGNFRLDRTSYWTASADGGLVQEGGAGKALLGRTTPRNIYTYTGTTDKNLSDAANAFSTTNTTNLTSGMLGVADDTEKDKLINYVYGKEAYAPTSDMNGNTIPDNQENREWIMGDILHSKPLVVNYNAFSYSNENTCPDADPNASIKTVIYVGGNDGMLHAFRDRDGKELWGFIPPGLLPKLKDLTGAAHSIFVDASPVVYRFDKNKDGNIDATDGDKVILVFGLRRGGSAYYALDVTNPLQPVYLWKIDPSTTGFEELGQTWSEPQLGKVMVGSAKEIVAFVGAGYDNDYEDRRFGNTQYFTDNVTDPPANSESASTSTGSTTTSCAKGR